MKFHAEEAVMPSFDIASRIDFAEVDNALAESARHPKDLNRLLHSPPFAPFLSDAIAQRELIDGGPENDVGHPLAFELPFPPAPDTRAADSPG
jgi:hypothetical protein